MDKLTADLKLDILSRLSIKNLGSLMCVSKELHRFIAKSCFPTKVYAVAIREENCHARSWTISVFRDIFQAGINLDLPAEINMSRSTTWLDYCNGLLLLWHSGGKSLPRYYIVINPLTKQSVTVDKPLAKSRDRDYAVLAYDAARSKYFKIVRFETSTHMKVFFSETGRWLTFLYQLPDPLKEADYVKQCIYFKGALYRLSTSAAHLMRFNINNIEESNSTEVARAKAINLPNEFQRSELVQECLGILNGRLCLSLSGSLNLRIWELQLPIDGTYPWSLKYEIARGPSTNDSLFRHGNRVIALDPYSSVVYPLPQYYLDRGTGFRIRGNLGFCLTDNTSFEVGLLLHHPERARKRNHFHPIVLCLSQFAKHQDG